MDITPFPKESCPVAPNQPDLVFYDGSQISSFVSRDTIKDVVKRLRHYPDARGLLAVFIDIDTHEQIYLTFAVSHTDLLRYEQAITSKKFAPFLIDELAHLETLMVFDQEETTYTKTYLWEMVSASITSIVKDHQDEIGATIALSAGLLTMEPMTELLGLLICHKDNKLVVCEMSVFSHRTPTQSKDEPAL